MATVLELQGEINKNLYIIKKCNKEIKDLIDKIKKSKNEIEKNLLRKNLLKKIYTKRIKLKINRVNKQEIYYAQRSQN